MLIAQISDSHIALPHPGEHDRASDLSAAVDFINALDVQPELVVHTGDVSHNGLPAEYELAKKILDRLEAPMVAIPGNRDDRQVMRQHFEPAGADDCDETFLQFSMTFDEDRIILLDTLSDDGNLGQFCSDRLMHLMTMLDRAGASRVGLFMHHPPFEVATIPQPFQFDDTATTRTLETLLLQYPQIRFIACGHVHRPFRTTFAGATAETLPALAADLRKGRPVNMPEMVRLLRLGH
jgi:3',5'-cyclic AMP phosphodiesterase CpdA